jgi:hypothetical protein
VSLPTHTFRSVTYCTDPRCVSVQRCQRAEHERYGNAPGENYGPRCVPVPAPSRPLTNDDLARAYDMGRDMERADTVAWLREPGEYVDPACARLADCIERGVARRPPTGRPEPEPVPSDLALGKRIVACRGWRWTAGMIRRDGYRVCWRKPPPAFREDDAVPDLSDDATLGCIVGVLREVAGDPHLYLCAGGGDPQTGVWHVRWGDNCSRRGRTEAEALVRAWEALS